MNAFLIAGTGSGVGKTSITLSLILALKKTGYNIQPFKVGPDFIDTGYHSLASGAPSINLDGWMLSKEYNISNFYLHIKNKDIAIVEGVMGFYDGFSGVNEAGSSAEIAKWLNLPVILIVNAKSMARSVAAIVYGFENFDKNVNIKGVIFNNVSGENHFSYLKESVSKYCRAEVLGYFQKNDFTSLPSRHLGLVTVDDNNDLDEIFKNFGEIALKRLDINKLLKLTNYNFNCQKKLSVSSKIITKKVKIAVARDKAFCFYYYDNLKLFERYGAEIIFFSPLYDKKLPENVQVIYFGGGYPELYAEKLSENKILINHIREFSENNGLIYAECGGFMYLTKGIHSFNNKFYKMVGIFDDEAVMYNKLKVLGYSKVILKENCFLGEKGDIIKGHEFHYSYLKNSGRNLCKIYDVIMRRKNLAKEEGYIYRNTIGSYIHLHFGSNKNAIKNMLSSLNYK